MPRRLILKAKKEAKRLSDKWRAEHLSKNGDELAALRRAKDESEKGMEAIRNVFCRAHITGMPCICKASPDYQAALQALEPHIKALDDFYHRMLQRYDETYQNYFRTIIRGLKGRIKHQGGVE